jgi:hypothetical protein
LESLHLLTPQDQSDVKWVPGQKIRVAFPTIDVLATLIQVNDTKAIVDTHLGIVRVPLANCAHPSTGS